MTRGPQAPTGQVFNGDASSFLSKTAAMAARGVHLCRFERNDFGLGRGLTAFIQEHPHFRQLLDLRILRGVEAPNCTYNAMQPTTGRLRSGCLSSVRSVLSGLFYDQSPYRRFAKAWR
jgi:hypothetical protein